MKVASYDASLTTHSQPIEQEDHCYCHYLIDLVKCIWEAVLSLLESLGCVSIKKDLQPLPLPLPLTAPTSTDKPMHPIVPAPAPTALPTIHAEPAAVPPAPQPVLVTALKATTDESKSLAAPAAALTTLPGADSAKPTFGMDFSFFEKFVLDGIKEIFTREFRRYSKSSGPHHFLPGVIWEFIAYVELFRNLKRSKWSSYMEFGKFMEAAISRGDFKTGIMKAFFQEFPEKIVHTEDAQFVVNEGDFDKAWNALSEALLRK